ncbi:ribokinase [Tessaracoccus oleiagri]|uniref:Ribokinase n=1 Tax=Tessaracoccus oleiagri TaxID=686624 RepID=A0A1G9I7C2_9ACTN|nr:ribokinase [Tessaracoccus oleiagri]SDL20724.1 ribokinase [Tessaracoccus oleiagri]
MSQVVIVGSINADLAVDVERHPLPGETLHGSDVVYSPGGKGANQAVAAASLGANVTMVGAVGNDANAEVALERLAASAVDRSRIRRTDAPTGLAIVVVDERGENTIIVAPGANALMDAAMVEEAADVVREADVVVMQAEIPVSGIERAAELVAGRLVFNLAPVTEVPREVLRRADPLVVNEHEGRLALRMLTGRDAADSTDEAIVDGLVAAGCRSVVMTLGSRGSIVHDGSGGAAAIPSAKVDVVDSTGAGDAFVGALVKGLAEGATLVDAARYASRVGAFACTRKGAQTSYPTTADPLPELPA